MKLQSKFGMQEWQVIDKENLPSELLICEWMHQELGIIEGHIHTDNPSRQNGYSDASWVYPTVDRGADIWLGEFTHFRKFEQKPKITKKTYNLKPCPFCGSDETNDLILGQVPPAHFQIKCGCCQVSMKHDRQDKVIGLWNARDLKIHTY